MGELGLLCSRAGTPAVLAVLLSARCLWLWWMGVSFAAAHWGVLTPRACFPRLLRALYYQAPRIFLYYQGILCPGCQSPQMCFVNNFLPASFALQKTTHPLYHTKPQSLWLHIHFRHDITPPVSDITPPVSLSSQPLHWYHTHFCMTSHPLYVWHPMHYI